MYNFPASPALDQVYTPPGGSSYKWNGYGWSQLAGEAVGVDEAPIDGIDYVRKNAAWNVLPVTPADWATITGKPSTFPPDAHTHAYSSLTGIPATFPPTLPIAQADVTGLVAGQSAQDTAIGTKLASSAYTAADVLAKLITVDGTGSSLDADLLDGNDSAFFATASSVSGKEPTIAAGTAAQYWQGTKTWQTLDKAAVGLGSVDNTADSAKPVSTAQQTAIDGRVADTGDTMTGDLRLNATAPNIQIDKVAGNESSLKFRTGTANRWEIISDNAAESAGNGSHFRIYRNNDAGTRIDTPFTINRSTGTTSITGSMTVSALLTSASTMIARSATAVPAGGMTALLASSTSNLGICIGSGAPTLTAAKGSLYLNTTAATNTTRMYVNTDGATTWTGVNTVA